MKKEIIKCRVNKIDFIICDNIYFIPTFFTKHFNCIPNKYFLVIFVLLLITINVSARVVELVAENPMSDTVTMIFHTGRGNKALQGYSGNVYLHTGVITDKSLNSDKWQHVTSNGAKDGLQVRMKKNAVDTSVFRFIIKDLYGLDSEEKVQQLVNDFHDVDGSIIGKTVHNDDILLPVADYRKPVKKTAIYLFKNRKYRTHSFDRNILKVFTDHGLVRYRFFTDKIVEVQHFNADSITADSSVAVILQPQQIKVNFKNTKNSLQLSTDSLLIFINKNPFYTAFVYHADTLLSEDKGYFQRSGNNGLQFKIAKNERYYGLGERAVDHLKGNRFQLYNHPHYGYEMGAKNLNFSVPLLLSSRNYLLLFDNPQKGYADIGKTNKNILEFGAIGGVMKYWFIAGYDIPALYAQYGQLTGTQPLPPRWALGNLQSRMAYRTQYETDSIVSLMQSKDFPIDAIILDFYWFGDSIKGTMGRLSWYKPNWPHPKQMIADFRKKGVKTVLITEPYIIDTLKNYRIGDSLGIFATDSLGKTYINHQFYFGNAALIDIFKPVAQRWFWQQYQKQIKIGVAGWWGDLGEPESHPSDQYHINGSADAVHNLYAHYWNKMLFDNYRKYYPDTRLFNLNRAGYAGSQRFSIYPWTGDVLRSWGGLQAQLPLMINMSLSGFPFIHADAGGFAQGKKNDELYTRWLQFACFSPILRPHSSHIPSEPVFFNDTTQRIVRKYMKLRYSLLPYLYTAAWRAHTYGSPIIQPLFYQYPNDEIARKITDEYFWGNDILVAPVLKAGQKTRKVYLPQGSWYNWWNNTKYEGNQWIEMRVTLENIPVFVRAGAFIPMVKPVNSTDNYSSQKLTLRYFPVSSGKTTENLMYEDDGKTFGAYEKGKYELLRFRNIHGTKFIFTHSGKKKQDRFITLIIMNKNHQTISFLWKSDETVVLRQRNKRGGNFKVYHLLNKKR